MVLQQSRLTVLTFNFLGMTVPVKSLVQVNLLMAVVSSSLVGIFLFAYLGIHAEEIFSVVSSFTGIVAISFFHVLVLVKITKLGSYLTAKQKRLYRYVITYTAALVYSICISPIRLIFKDESWRVITFEQQVITIIFSSIGLNTLILIMHNLVLIYHARNDAEIENAELKVANIEATNELLKQQIHPHFLFNALNVLKSLYKTDIQAGDTYIVHLANFLRASITSTAAKGVSLIDEIKICNDYIAMQKIRFGEALQCSINIPAAESRQGLVPSFSLQPLLENAIKHNTVTNEQPLLIDVYTEDGYVVVKNKLQRKTGPVPSTGNGLVNLMKRYELLSGDEVIIQEDDIYFSVRLKILQA